MVAQQHAARRGGEGEDGRGRDEQPDHGERGQRLPQQQKGGARGEQGRRAAHHREDQRQVAALQGLDEAELVTEMRRRGEGERAPDAPVGRRHDQGSGDEEQGGAHRQDRPRDEDVDPHLHRHVGGGEGDGGEQAEGDGEKGRGHRPYGVRSNLPTVSRVMRSP
jgi:hypothetical protein